MQRITVEQQQAARGARGRLNAVSIDHCAQGIFWRHTNLLLLQRLFVMFVWRFSYTGNEMLMGSGNQH